MLTTDRMATIMVDADLGRPRTGYAEAELFRAKVELEIAAIHARGGILEIPFALPDLFDPA